MTQPAAAAVSPPVPPTLNAPFPLNYYEKTGDQYWFEFITEEQIQEKGNAWSLFLSTTMADYFTIVQDQGHDPHQHRGFLDYFAAGCLFLKRNNLQIRLRMR
tara:strand:+ start:109 stop:414 length:306 start_codon:yes stop_codon:yes gene_type:complete